MENYMERRNRYLVSPELLEMKAELEKLVWTIDELVKRAEERQAGSIADREARFRQTNL